MEKFLRSNLFAWILALLLAIALWLFVMGDSITRVTSTRMGYRAVPLAVETLEDGPGIFHPILAKPIYSTKA